MAEDDKKELEVKTFKQEDVDKIVSDRISRERSKYGDYDELKKFKDEQLAKQDEAKNKNLEEAQKYEELKKGWETEKVNYNKAIADKDDVIKDIKIDNALENVINVNNAYPEAKHTVKALVKLDEHGMPKMMGKDSVGNDTLIDLDEGVKKFLADKPYLVKGQKVNGTNTNAGNTGGEQGGTETLEQLNAGLIQARNSGNYKEAEALKVKISAALKASGINRNM